MIGWLSQQFQHNQLAQAAVLAAPMTALVYTARNLPLRLWSFLKRTATVEIGFNSDIPDYLAVQSFVAEHIASTRFSRSFLYSCESKWDREAGEDIVTHGLTLGYGPHFGFWRGRVVWINRSSIDAPGVEKFKERLSLTFLTRRRAFLNGFVEQVRAHGERALDREHVSLFINSGGWWRLANKLPARSMATVFTEAGQASALVEHLQGFDARRDWYRSRGLPWHTGILLTGKPGTGKTSLIHAAASTLGRSIHYLNLGSVESDQQLTDLVSSGRDWRRSILVIEDADATGAQISRTPAAVDGEGAAEPRKPLTLSALLNLLDGLLTPDGLVVIATSNHPDRLDPALLRAGRFDLQLELGELAWPQFAAMARLFGDDLADDDPRRGAYLPAPGADLRAKLLGGGVDTILAPRREAA